MPVVLTPNDVYRQSTAVFKQFGKSHWIPYATENIKLPHKNTETLRNVGIGKFMLCVGMGASLEKNIDLIKEYRDKVDIFACDKAFCVLAEHGIKSDYVMLCDCNIPYSWLEKYIDQTEGVNLISTLYANTAWTKTWKGQRHYYVNKDAIMSERIFLNIAKGSLRTIPASSNVSNAVVVFALGSDEIERSNFMGYEKYLLIGYDYSWKPDGQYYAFNDPRPKRFYMNHRTMLDIKNDVVFTSENLFFSAKWLYSYVTCHNLPVVNCSETGLLDIPEKCDLKKALELAPDTKLAGEIRVNFEVAKTFNMNFMAAKEKFDISRRKITNGNR